MKKLIFLFLIALSISCKKTDVEDMKGKELAIEEVLSGSVLIDVNPFEKSSLSALLTFNTLESCKVSLYVLGEIPMEKDFDNFEKEHALPLLGLYAGRVNEVILRLELENEDYALDTLFVETDPLPTSFPDIDILSVQATSMEQGWNFMELSFGGNWSFRAYPAIFDHNGAIRWYLKNPIGQWINPVKRLSNGNLIFNNWGDPYILEYDMLGQEINKFETPGYTVHHEVLEKPDGNLLVAVNKNGLDTEEDFIIEYDRNSGSVVKEWDLRQNLDIDRQVASASQGDWFHLNAMAYDPVDNAIIASGRYQGIVKLSAENELKWILAPHLGWGKSGVEGDGFETSNYLLNAIDQNDEQYPDSIQNGFLANEAFDWTWGQHAVMLLPNGNIFVFDNGFKRQFTNGPPKFSRGVEFEIDETNKTVKQIWQFGKELGEAFHSEAVSDVDLLPKTENRLITSGRVALNGDYFSRILEVSYPDKQIVFEAMIHFKNEFSTGTNFSNLDVIYRSERMTLYPD